MTLTPERVDQLISAFAGERILVLGDIMLDEFIWGKVRRISPEAPVPVVEVSRESYHLGGAGNVAANLCALGAASVPIGIVGQDAAAERLMGLLDSQSIESAGLIAEAGRPTTVKTRVVAHSQQIVRTDRESKAPLADDRNEALLAAFLKWLPSCKAVVISDYDKGVVNRWLLSRALPAAEKNRIPVLLDPKVHHADYYRPVTLIKPNLREAELLTGISIRDDNDLTAAGRLLLAKFGCPYVLISHGEEGMSLFSKEGAHHRFPTFAREVFDVSGAGDTVMATLALSLAAGGTMEESAILANHAAGIVVGKVGTATVSRGELTADFASRNAHSTG
jgi:D-beta-D-heptose 7-phosphate kinase/D-beta-D-heptose 1-phosphate adenosyltransferase